MTQWVVIISSFHHLNTHVHSSLLSMKDSDVCVSTSLVKHRYDLSIVQFRKLRVQYFIDIKKS